MKQFQFKKYCSPAQLYLVLAAIGLVLGFFQNFRVMTLIVHSAFVVLFGFLLNMLCKKGYTSISWVIVALPFVFFLCSYFLALDASDAKDNELIEGNDPNAIIKSFKEGLDMDMQSDCDKCKEENPDWEETGACDERCEDTVPF